MFKCQCCGREWKTKLPQLFKWCFDCVEKMDKDGEVYYVAEKYSAGWSKDYGCKWVEEWGRITSEYDTLIEAQEAANIEVEKERKKAEKKAEKERRDAYAKVMGEFKP